ncbi:MAG: hypothetical protein MPI82_06035 [Nitrosopumilus sp.]|nr:hypothetical protein [Nitrosopumilus sp.]
MNPITIAGILAVTMASAGMMVSFSAQQVQYSQAVEQAASMQAERLQERLAVTVEGGVLLVENAGPVPVRIREIRAIDDAGLVSAAQPVDITVGISGVARPELDPGIAEAVVRVAGGGR